MRVADLVLAALVHCYPRSFRERYAREVDESARGLIRQAWSRGVLQGLCMTLSVMVDLVRSISTERRLSRIRGEAVGGGRFDMGTIGHDVRDALRQVRRNPSFTAAAVLTLSLALGGVTAVFAIADPLLFRPLPYPDSDRIVQLTSRSERGPHWLFAADYVALIEGSRNTMEAIGKVDSVLYAGRLREQDDPSDYVVVNGASPEFLNVLGVRPNIGRTFRPEEHAGARVALITHALWQSAYGGRTDIVGQPLTLFSSRPTTLEIVGVLPAGFVYPDFVNAAPVAIAPSDVDRARAASMARYMSMPLARLKSGATPEAAAAELAGAMAAVEAQAPHFRTHHRVPVVRTLRSVMYAEARRPMTLLLGVTAFVALLAALNLAHLFLARSVARARELATRTALGATRGQIVRMLLVEALMIAILGWAGALAVGRVFRDAVLTMLPETAHLYRAVPSTLDARVVLATGLLALASLLLFGLWPALRAARADLRAVIAEGQGGRKSSFAQSGLVFAQTSAAVAVLLTTLLLASGFARLANQPLGFEADGIMSAWLHPTTPLNRDPAQLRHLNLEMQQRVTTITGRPAALAAGIPGVTIPIGMGRLDQDRDRYQIIGYPVTAEFFDVFGIRLLRGRLPSVDEALTDQPVVVVDERAAALSWPGQDPLGRQLRDNVGVVRSVIGVVGELKTHLFTITFQDATAFVPLPAQHQRLYQVLWSGEPSEAVRRDLAAFAGTLLPRATASAAPLDIFGRQLGQPRFLATLLGVLGALAIALTVIGLYGVVSHGVAQRTREMGIRIALGAETVRIARLIVMQTLRPAALGVALGLSISLWWAETLRTLLYGFTPHDWRVFAAAGMLVLLLVALACVLPIRRATRVDPLIALKAE